MKDFIMHENTKGNLLVQGYMPYKFIPEFRILAACLLDISEVFLNVTATVAFIMT
jgi:hypothetical protein